MVRLRNPRFLADITGNGSEDMVGFGSTGVWTALSNGDGTFKSARVVLGRALLRKPGAGTPAQASAVPR